MKTTLCSKVHCFIIDLRTTRMFSHLYITSKVLKNISISITHGFVSIVSCRAEPCLAPSITTHHHCAESAENRHSLKTIEGLIRNKRSFCSHGPITDYSSSGLWSRCRNLILGPNSLQYLRHQLSVCGGHLKAITRYFYL